MKIGIIGLPASGKTTLFNALTGGAARTGAYGGGQLHVGVAQVADPRVDALSAIFKPKKTTYATVDFADVPGLGSEEGEGAKRGAEAIPPALQGADALLLVVRAFGGPGVPHPKGSVDPARDLAGVRLDLILRDMAVVERRLERLARTVPLKKDPAEAAELEVLKRVQAALDEGKTAASLGLPEEEMHRLRGFGFLSAKPLLVVVNAGEEDIAKPAAGLGVAEEGAIVLCARLEEELAQLPGAERADFLAGYGLERPARDRVVQASFALLGLICFLTVGEDEVRSWPLRRGDTALRAAGAIHSDLERGFIRAEVIAYGDFMKAGSLAAGRERGTLRLEGRDYAVRDGDILNIRFNV
ncbi:MAG: DUF933 domain-containing protein [Nitrospinota bacterium]